MRRFFLALLTLTGHAVFAQQDFYKLRAGAGVGNIYRDAGILSSGMESSDAFAEISPEYLSYNFHFERLLSKDFGLRLFLNTTPEAEKIRNGGLQLNYYTDNGYLFSERSWIAPYFGIGAAMYQGSKDFNVRGSAGLKFRIGTRFNLNLEYSGLSFTDSWTEEDAKLVPEQYASVSLSYNFFKRRYSFRGPEIYLASGVIDSVKSLPGPEKVRIVDSLAIDSISSHLYQTFRDSLLTTNIDIIDSTAVDSIALEMADSVIAEDTTTGVMGAADTLNDQQYTGAFAILPVADTLAEEKQEKASPLQERRDSILAGLEFEIEKQRLKNELARLRRSPDSLVPMARDTMASASRTGEQGQNRKISQLSQQLDQLTDAINRQPVRETRVEPAQESQNYSRYQEPDPPGYSLVVANLESQNKKIDQMQEEMDSLRLVILRNRERASFQNQSDTVPEIFEVSDTLGRDSVAAIYEAQLQALETLARQSFQKASQMEQTMERLNKKLDSIQNFAPSPQPLPDTVVSAPEPVEPAMVQVFFDNNSTELDQAALQQLDEILKVTRKNPEAKFVIRGFTDKSGAREYNMMLSQKRAQAVQTYLVNRGIDASRLEMKSQGPDESLTEKRSQYGRRVEVEVKSQ